MLKKDLTLALAQLPYQNGRPDAALEQAEKTLNQARACGADIVVFPELYYQGCCNSSRTFHQLAETNSGSLTRWLSEKARSYGLYLVMGFCQKKDTEPGKLFNTTLFYGKDGTLIGDYVKVYGWGKENLIFTPGTSFPVYDTPFGKIGFLTCYDIEFAEPFRILAFRGADLIIVTSAWSKHLQIRWRAGLSAGAIQNLLPIAACNAVGPNPAGLPLAGDSRVISPFGHILASANDTGKEELLICRLDAASLNQEREDYPLWRDFHPDMFDRSLLERY